MKVGRQINITVLWLREQWPLTGGAEAEKEGWGKVGGAGLLEAERWKASAVGEWATDLEVGREFQ